MQCAGERRAHHLAQPPGGGHQGQIAARVAGRKMSDVDQADRRQPHEGSAEQPGREQDEPDAAAQHAQRDACRLDQAADREGALVAPASPGPAPECHTRRRRQADAKPDQMLRRLQHGIGAHHVGDEGGGDDVAEADQAVSDDQAKNAVLPPAGRGRTRRRRRRLRPAQQHPDRKRERETERAAEEPRRLPVAAVRCRRRDRQGRDRDAAADARIHDRRPPVAAGGAEPVHHQGGREHHHQRAGDTVHEAQDQECAQARRQGHGAGAEAAHRERAQQSQTSALPGTALHAAARAPSR